MKNKFLLSSVLFLISLTAFTAVIDKFDTITTNSPTKAKVEFIKGIKVNSTDSVILPVGTTAQRDTSPSAGMVRQNSTTGTFEGYLSAAWRNFLTYTTTIDAPVDLNMNSHKITNLVDPTSAQDGATKKYIDDALAGVDFSNLVDRTTNQSIAGNKTFTGTTTVSNPLVGSITGNAATVTTNANLAGAVTSIGNATSLGSFTSANLSGALSDETGTGVAVFGTSPTLTTPTFSGTAVGSINGNAATVTTNANLTGPITSVGNATSIASQTGTGSKIVVDTSPTLVTPVLGVATATSINGSTIPTSKTLVVTTDKLSALSATTSAELAGVISDETGTGSVVLGTSPTVTIPSINVEFNFVLVTEPSDGTAAALINA